VSEFVAILEDEQNRIAAMRGCLAEILPGREVVFFEHAQEMIAWLGEHLGQVVLLSLDHDLPVKSSDGNAVDCGTGRQVADYLATVPPSCPVIVHSSNDTCATGMFFALKDSGWPCGRVVPCNYIRWIADAWADKVRQYICDGWISAGSAAVEDEQQK